MSHVHVARYHRTLLGEAKKAAKAISKAKGVISSRVFTDHHHVILVTEFSNWGVLDNLGDEVKKAANPLASKEGGGGEFWFGTD